MKVHIKLFGQLYWYVKKKKELIMEIEPCDMEELVNLLKLPIGEVSFVTINGTKAELNTPLCDGDIIEIYPIIGGG